MPNALTLQGCSRSGGGGDEVCEAQTRRLLCRMLLLGGGAAAPPCTHPSAPCHQDPNCACSIPHPHSHPHHPVSDCELYSQTALGP